MEVYLLITLKKFRWVTLSGSQNNNKVTRYSKVIASSTVIVVYLDAIIAIQMKSNV